MIGSRSKDFDENFVKRVKLDESLDERSNRVEDMKSDIIVNDFTVKLEPNNELVDFEDFNSFVKSENIDSYELFGQSQFDLKEDSISNDCFQSYDSRSESGEQSQDSSNLKIVKVKTVLEKELHNELSQAKEDVETIEDRIFEVRQCLIKIRHSVVSEFYEQKKSTKTQKPLHRAVKKILGGKEPANLARPECSNFEPTLRSSRTRSRNKILKEVVEEAKSDEDVDVTDNDHQPLNVTSPSISKVDINCKPAERLPKSENGVELNVRLPRYVPPKPFHKPVANFNEPRANIAKSKIRLTVGNVSKWLGNDCPDRATHKWTVYIKCSESGVDLSKIIHRAKYFLHPSYKPNDTVVVNYPFKLTRRGWGEFPVRICLEFIDKNDKPVDIYHNLKLDRTYLGLETFGGETVVDVWVHLDNVGLPNKSESTTLKKSNESDVFTSNSNGVNMDLETVNDVSLFLERKVKCESLDNAFPSSSMYTSLVDESDFDSSDTHCEQVLIDFECSNDGFTSDKNTFEGWTIQQV